MLARGLTLQGHHFTDALHGLQHKHRRNVISTQYEGRQLGTARLCGRALSPPSASFAVLSIRTPAPALARSGSKASWVCKSEPNSARTDGHQSHPHALTPLYWMYLYACFVERMWRFGLPLVLAHLPGGFQAIAIIGATSPLACTLLVPVLGRVLDRVWRPYGLGALVALQDLSILGSCIALAMASAYPGAGALVDSPLFVVLVLLSMSERLAAAVSEMVIERDWVPQLAGKHNVDALAESNCRLKRTDLACELVGSLIFGVVFSKAGLATSVLLTSLVAFAALPLQLHSIFKIARLAPSAMVHSGGEVPTALFKPQWRRLLPNAAPQSAEQQPSKPKKPLWLRVEEQIAHALDGWQVYFRQPILASSLAYCSLYLNVVLAPGGLITHLLTSWGMGGTASAVFRGGCAASGFLGTWLGKTMIQTVGLLRAGQNALFLQVSLLSAATVLYFRYLSGPPQLGIPCLLGSAAQATLAGIPIPAVAFAALVAFSRCAVWAFEMVNAQLFQQTVAQREMSSSSSAEMALASFAELSMLAVAAWQADAGSYGRLVCASLGAVIMALTVYSAWARWVGQDEGGELHAAVAA